VPLQHGDKDQAEREYSLDLFRKGKAPLLVATDVAARGLDIPGVAMVLVYDFPMAVEVGPGRYWSPLHPTHLTFSLLE
jgi:superfamily II DNA/RNA helicase